MKKLLAANARGLKAAMLLAGLMLAVGAGSAFAQDTLTRFDDPIPDEVVFDSTKDLLVKSGVHAWKEDRIPTADDKVANVRMTGGKLMVGNTNDTGGLEVGRFIMTGGDVTVGGKVVSGAGAWVNETSFITGGWQGVSANETTANASVSITGGTVNLLDGGRIQTTAQGSTVTGDAPRYSGLFHIGDKAIINMNGSSLANAAVLKAHEYHGARVQATPTSQAGWYTRMLIDGNAAINIGENNYGVILSRDTTMDGGNINVSTGGTLRVQGGWGEGAEFLASGINHPGIVHWGDFDINNGKIDNKGVIDFATGKMTLNASGGELTGNLSLTDTAASVAATTYATNLHVLEGGSFAIGGNLDIANGMTFENLGTLAIGGTTNAAGPLTLAGGSSTTFTGAVTVSGGMNVGDGTTAASATFGDNLIGAVNVKDGSSMTVNGTITGATDVTLGKNTTLSIAEAGGLKATGTLNVQNSTKLNVAVNATDIAKHGTLEAARIALNGNDSDKDAINAYLQTQNTGSLISNTTFSMDETGKLVFAVTEQKNAAQGMENALTTAGIGEMASGMSASASSSLASILTGKAAEYAAGSLPAQGMETYRLMDSVFGAGGVASSAEARSIVSTLAGFDVAKSIDIATVTANSVATRVNARVSANNLARANAGGQVMSNDALASPALANSFANRFWIGGFGLWENADQRGWDAGYEYKSGGFITGYDRVFGPITVGGSFAYTSGSYEDKNALSSDSNIDSYAFNLYGTYNHSSGLFATLMGGYTYSDYDMKNLVTRGGQWNKADFHGNTWTIGGTLGYDIRPTQCLTITPSIGLYHYMSSTNTFRTRFQNNMKVEQDSTELPIDLSVGYDIPAAGGNLRLTANTGYAYSFSKDGGELDAFGYNGIGNSRISGIKGRENARHTWNVGAGATYSAGRFDVGVKYDYYAKSDYDAHRVMGTVGIGF